MLESPAAKAAAAAEAAPASERAHHKPQTTSPPIAEVIKHLDGNLESVHLGRS